MKEIGADIGTEFEGKCENEGRKSRTPAQDPVFFCAESGVVILLCVGEFFPYPHRFIYHSIDHFVGLPLG